MSRIINRLLLIMGKQSVLEPGYVCPLASRPHQSRGVIAYSAYTFPQHLFYICDMLKILEATALVCVGMVGVRGESVTL